MDDAPATPILLEARDLRDATRTAAPLLAAPDAIVLDTSLLGRDEAIARAIALVDLARQKTGEADQ